MSETLLGAEIMAFVTAWPPGDDWYHSNDDGQIEDLGSLEPARRYSSGELGVFSWQGQGEPSGCPLGKDEDQDVIAWVQHWLRTQKVVALAVEVPREQEAALRAFLDTIGGCVR